MTYPYDTSFVVMTSESFPSPVHACWWDREFGTIQAAELRGAVKRPGSVGRPIPGADIRIVDETGKPVPLGSKGSVAVKLGPGCPFVEFWEDPGLTHTQVRDGWFVTTHSGHMDADGYLWIES
jgi:acyl-coenzyme A synthetase/AMP-(fatty) acid ligase